MINKLLIMLLLISIFENIFCQERVRIKPTLPTSADFLAKPFGFETSKNNFLNNYKQWKMKLYTTKLTSNQTFRDTFFDFSYKKSRVVFLKSNNTELLFSGNIDSDNFLLANNIRIGMSRYEFVHSFSDLKSISNDTIMFQNSKLTNYFAFYFKNSKLEKINFGLKKSLKKK